MTMAEKYMTGYQTLVRSYERGAQDVKAGCGPAFRRVSTVE